MTTFKIFCEVVVEITDILNAYDFLLSVYEHSDGWNTFRADFTTDMRNDNPNFSALNVIADILKALNEWNVTNVLISNTAIRVEIVNRINNDDISIVIKDLHRTYTEKR